MVKSARVNLTVQRIVEATCPPGKSEAILQDAVVPGLGVRVYPTGRKAARCAPAKRPLIRTSSRAATPASWCAATPPPERRPVFSSTAGAVLDAPEVDAGRSGPCLRQKPGDTGHVGSMAGRLAFNSCTSTRVFSE
jgi:hypothetical protein